MQQVLENVDLRNGEEGCTGNKKLEKAELFMVPLWMGSIEIPGDVSTSPCELKIAQISSAHPAFQSMCSLSKIIYSYGDVSNEPSKSRLIYHMVFQ